MSYYGREEKKGWSSIRLTFLEETYSQDPGPLVVTVSAFVSNLSSFKKCMYFSIKT